MAVQEYPPSGSNPGEPRPARKAQKFVSPAWTQDTTQAPAGASRLQASTIHSDIPKSLNPPPSPRPYAGSPMAPHLSPPSPKHWAEEVPLTWRAGSTPPGATASPSRLGTQPHPRPHQPGIEENRTRGHSGPWPRSTAFQCNTHSA
ncbi:hypothetical protein CHARACLAT_032619 [Characodon lateralis]|uniref:Uncharacterized protein n=1 Tax=Characodon lateralis TaxID=208331 RepID=A0ABU7EZ61_9TELE|nr:hypothetical protein [Characodon lateralis]